MGRTSKKDKTWGEYLSGNQASKSDNNKWKSADKSEPESKDVCAVLEKLLTRNCIKVADNATQIGTPYKLRRSRERDKKDYATFRTRNFTQNNRLDSDHAHNHSELKHNSKRDSINMVDSSTQVEMSSKDNKRKTAHKPISDETNFSSPNAKVTSREIAGWLIEGKPDLRTRLRSRRKHKTSDDSIDDSYDRYITSLAAKAKDAGKSKKEYRIKKEDSTKIIFRRDLRTHSNEQDFASDEKPRNPESTVNRVTTTRITKLDSIEQDHGEAPSFDDEMNEYTMSSKRNKGKSSKGNLTDKHPVSYSHTKTVKSREINKSSEGETQVFRVSERRTHIEALNKNTLYDEAKSLKDIDISLDRILSESQPNNLSSSPANARTRNLKLKPNVIDDRTYTVPENDSKQGFVVIPYCRRTGPDDSNAPTSKDDCLYTIKNTDEVLDSSKETSKNGIEESKVILEDAVSQESRTNESSLPSGQLYRIIKVNRKSHKPIDKGANKISRVTVEQQKIKATSYEIESKHISDPKRFSDSRRISEAKQTKRRDSNVSLDQSPNPTQTLSEEGAATKSRGKHSTSPVPQRNFESKPLYSSDSQRRETKRDSKNRPPKPSEDESFDRAQLESRQNERFNDLKARSSRSPKRNTLKQSEIKETHKTYTRRTFNTRHGSDLKQRIFSQPRRDLEPTSKKNTSPTTDGAMTPESDQQESGASDRGRSKLRSRKYDPPPKKLVPTDKPVNQVEAAGRGSLSGSLSESQQHERWSAYKLVANAVSPKEKKRDLNLRTKPPSPQRPESQQKSRWSSGRRELKARSSKPHHNSPEISESTITSPKSKYDSSPTSESHQHEGWSALKSRPETGPLRKMHHSTRTSGSSTGYERSTPFKSETNAESRAKRDSTRLAASSPDPHPSQRLESRKYERRTPSKTKTGSRASRDSTRARLSSPEPPQSKYVPIQGSDSQQYGERSYFQSETDAELRAKRESTKRLEPLVAVPQNKKVSTRVLESYQDEKWSAHKTRTIVKSLNERNDSSDRSGTTARYPKYSLKQSESRHLEGRKITHSLFSGRPRAISPRSAQDAPTKISPYDTYSSRKPSPKPISQRKDLSDRRHESDSKQTEPETQMGTIKSPLVSTQQQTSPRKESRQREHWEDVPSNRNAKYPNIVSEQQDDTRETSRQRIPHPDDLVHPRYSTDSKKKAQHENLSQKSSQAESQLSRTSSYRTALDEDNQIRRSDNRQEDLVSEQKRVSEPQQPEENTESRRSSDSKRASYGFYDNLPDLGRNSYPESQYQTQSQISSEKRESQLSESKRKSLSMHSSKPGDGGSQRGSEQRRGYISEPSKEGPEDDRTRTTNDSRRVSYEDDFPKRESGPFWENQTRVGRQLYPSSSPDQNQLSNETQGNIPSDRRREYSLRNAQSPEMQSESAAFHERRSVTESRRTSDPKRTTYSNDLIDPNQELDTNWPPPRGEMSQRSSSKRESQLSSTWAPYQHQAVSDSIATSLQRYSVQEDTRKASYSADTRRTSETKRVTTDELFDPSQGLDTQWLHLNEVVPQTSSWPPHDNISKEEVPKPFISDRVSREFPERSSASPSLKVGTYSRDIPDSRNIDNYSITERLYPKEYRSVGSSTKPDSSFHQDEPGEGIQDKAHKADAMETSDFLNQKKQSNAEWDYGVGHVLKGDSSKRGSKQEPIENIQPNFISDSIVDIIRNSPSVQSNPLAEFPRITSSALTRLKDSRRTSQQKRTSYTDGISKQESDSRRAYRSSAKSSISSPYGLETSVEIQEDQGETLQNDDEPISKPPRLSSMIVEDGKERYSGDMSNSKQEYPPEYESQNKFELKTYESMPFPYPVELVDEFQTNEIEVQKQERGRDETEIQKQERSETDEIEERWSESDPAKINTSLSSLSRMTLREDSSTLMVAPIHEEQTQDPYNQSPDEVCNYGSQKPMSMSEPPPHGNKATFLSRLSQLNTRDEGFIGQICDSLPQQSDPHSYNNELCTSSRSRRNQDSLALSPCFGHLLHTSEEGYNSKLPLQSPAGASIRSDGKDRGRESAQGENDQNQNETLPSDTDEDRRRRTTEIESLMFSLELNDISLERSSDAKSGNDAGHSKDEAEVSQVTKHRKISHEGGRNLNTVTSDTKASSKLNCDVKTYQMLPAGNESQKISLNENPDYTETPRPIRMEEKASLTSNCSNIGSLGQDKFYLSEHLEEQPKLLEGVDSELQNFVLYLQNRLRDCEKKVQEQIENPDKDKKENKLNNAQTFKEYQKWECEDEFELAEGEQSVLCPLAEIEGLPLPLESNRRSECESEACNCCECKDKNNAELNAAESMQSYSSDIPPFNGCECMKEDYYKIMRLAYIKRK